MESSQKKAQNKPVYFLKKEMKNEDNDTSLASTSNASEQGDQLKNTNYNQTEKSKQLMSVYNTLRCYQIPSAKLQSTQRSRFFTPLMQETPKRKKQSTDDNLNKTSKAPLPFDEPSSSSTTSTTQRSFSSQSQVPQIKVYQVHSGKISQGWEYQYKLTVLLALRCVRCGIKDWWIASNPEGVGDFDDLVVRLKRSNGKNTTLLLQLKHKDNPKNITQKDFFTSKGDFHLSKRLKTIVELHQSMYSKSKNFEIVKDLGAFSDTNFMFFTNRKADYCEFLENHSDASLSFLNTKTKAEMHRFNFTKLSLRDPVPDIVANCNLLMLSNQIHIDQTDTAIETEISKLKDTLKLSNVNIQDVAKGFSMHVRDWARGKLGGHYYFTKENVLCKLTELLLNQYTLNLIEKPIKKCINEKMHIWNQISANQVITVVDYSETVVNFLIEYICAEVQKYCDGSMQSWAETLSEKQKQSFHRNYSDLGENLLKNVGNRQNIHPLDIYKSLWRINKLPLLLISNPENKNTINGILKLSNYSYKVIVVEENVTISHKMEETYERKQKEKKEPTKSFRSLKDLDKEERNKILEQKVMLQGRPGAILGDIVNEKALQYITSRDILDILSGNFNIGNEIQEPVEYTIERTIITKGVYREVLRNCDKEIFLILGKFEEILNVLPSLGEYKIFDINDIDLNNSKNIPGIINIHEDITSLQLENLEKTKKPVHMLSVYDSNYLEWIWSYGCRTTIVKHEIQLKYKVNQEHIARLLSTAAIISDVPGMGKSVLTNYIAYHAPVNKWVLKIDLNAHQSYIRQQNAFSMDAFAHLRYFYETVCSNSDRNSELSRLIFENFLNLKKIAILLDGFDEVAASLKHEVTNMATSLFAKGFQVLITTRPVMKQHLEQTFKKTSFSIMPFTTEHQREYLTNFFASVHCDLKVPEPSKIQIFVEKLMQMVNENLNDLECTFMEIPLHTVLLANVFNSECKEYISGTGTTDFNNKYDLLYLYHKFIEKKINIVIEKYGYVAYEQHEEIKEYQALLAIKLIFPLEQIIEADTLTKVYLPFTNKPKLTQILQREGIMIVDGKGTITCVHRTIAELLAAQWLSDNLQNTNEEIKKFVHDLIIERFTRNYKFLFYAFDRILSENCPLHLAIINKQVNVALNIINSELDIINVRDKGGRSALHTVALNGLQHSLPYQDYRYSKTDVMLRIAQKLLHPEIILKSDILGYTPFDYALASCSLPIANELCTNTQAYFINIYIDLQFKEDYLKYFIYTPYEKLLQIVLPYFAYRDLLQNNVKKDTKLVTFYSDSKFRVTDYQNKNIIETLQSKYGKQYSDYIKKFSFDYYSDLRHAIACGSTSNVQQLLQHEETEINKSDMDNNSPLHYAVLHGRSKIVKMLLEKNAKVNKQNKNLNTPLHLSVLNYDIKITNMLLSKKVNLDNVNIKGETVLHLAFSHSANKIKDNKLLKLVKRISSNCTNINSENNAGETPLHYSVKNGYSKGIINYLLLCKADVNKMTNDGQTPLHFATMKGYYEIVQFLVANGAIVNAQDTDGYTPLFWAATEGRNEIVKFLVANGADVNAQDTLGCTPLFWAAQEGHDEIVKFLVANGTNINAQDAKGYTPLFWAAKEGRDEIVKFLVANGTNINAQDAKGYTPLFWAAKEGRDEIVKFLVANGADVNAQDTLGCTPLFWAAQEGHDEIVKFLVANGTNINAQDAKGYTPLFWAAKEGRDEIVKFLVANGTNINAQDAKSYTPLFWAAKEGHDKIVKFIVANGAKVNAQDDEGNTPLHLAVKYGNSDLIALLLRFNSDMDIKNTDGITPLHLAAKMNQTDVVKYLIEKGADINVEGELKNTPLHFVSVQQEPQDNKGGDFGKQNLEKKSILHLAAETGSRKVLKLLLLSKITQQENPNFHFSIDHILTKNCPLHRDIMQKQLKTVQELVSSNSNILRTVDEASRSILHMLANFDTDSSTDCYVAALTQEVLEYLGNDFEFDDIMGYNPLDYAIANRSLAVADKICEKLQDLPINIDIRNRGVYFMDCGKNKYEFLFTTLVRYFASREILSKHVSPTLESFIIDECENAMFIMSEVDSTIIATIKDYTNKLDKERILDLFKCTNNTYEDLRFAVTFGTAENVESLLTTEKNINKQDADKNTALHYSVTYNNPEYENIVARLLSNGAEINKCGKYGNTALHYAIKNKRKEAVTTLLEHDAEVNKQNDFGQTALHVVAKNGLTEIAKQLLQRNAEVNTKDNYGRIPLHYAANKKDHDILQLLLNHGALIDEEDSAKITPLTYAARADHKESVKLLLDKKADARRKDVTGRSALHWAVYYNAEKVVSLLLENNAEVKAGDNDGNTALHYTIRTCNENVVKQLLIHGVDLNASNNLKQTALHLACCRHYEIGNEEDCDDFEPIQHENITKNLITEENVNMIDCYGNTPLDYANQTLHKIKQYIDDSEDYFNDLKCYTAIISALDNIKHKK